MITVISVDEFLRTTCEQDCEYVHGALQKRSLPDWDHSGWQAALLEWFGAHKLEWGIYVRPELRVRVAADQFRVPDVTIISRQAPREPYLTHAPLAVFEILSPDDTMSGMMDKLKAYDAMGIPAIWVIDPSRASDQVTYRRYSQGKLVEADVFELAGTNLSVPMSEIAALVE